MKAGEAMTGGMMASDREAILSLPFARMIAVSTFAAAIAGGAWTLGAAIAGLDWNEAVVGAFGALITAVAMAAGLLVIGPWVARPISLWMTLWLGAMIVRFGLALGFSWLLYSASHAIPWAMLVGVGGVYFAALVSEVAVLAGFVRRASGG